METRCRLAVVPLIGLGLACASEPEPIRIGLVGPLSETRGESMRLGAELAVNEINARGGVGGRQLLLVARDDSATAERAVRMALELADTPGLVAVIGHLTSTATLAAAPIYNRPRDPVVAISPTSSSPAITAAGPFTFRICPDDGVHGARLAVWAAERMSARTVAVLYQNDDYGRGVRRAFTQSFTALGGTVISDDPYVDELRSLEPYLSRADRRGRPDGIMVAGTRAGAERVLLTLDSLGRRPLVFGGDGLAGLETSTLVNPEGTYISTAYLPDLASERNTAFVASYRAAYQGRAPDHRASGTFDIVSLLFRALEAGNVDRQSLRDYLAGVGTVTPAFEGVTGVIAFDEHGDVPAKEVVVGVVSNRRLVTAAP